jgi:hypothetical protein
MPGTERVRKYLEAGGVLGEVARARTSELARELGGSVDAVAGHLAGILRHSADLGRRTTSGLTGWARPRREPDGDAPSNGKAVC